MSQKGIAKRIGIGVGLAATLVLGAFLLVKSNAPGFSFLRSGQVVYAGNTATRYPGLKATEYFMNVPQNWKEAVKQVRKELPQAIERTGEDEPYFVVPQIENGRVRLSEFPEQSITVRPGKLQRVGARMMVLVGTGQDWSHIEVQDFREPSALESAFNWLGTKLGI